jgi:hypothetical protein
MAKLSYFKKVNYFLLSYYKKFCINVLKNLNNEVYKNIKRILSLQEIFYVIEGEDVRIPIYFSDQVEDYILDDNTTWGQLFENILIRSELLGNVSEKRLYWLYIFHTNINETQTVLFEE